MKDLLERYQGTGLFTHAYVAGGSLDEPKPRVEAALLPDGRDVFDLASLTKALATTVLAFDLVRHGEWALDQPPPALRGAQTPFSKLSLRDLLRHETGFPAWRNLWICHLGVDSEALLSDLQSRWKRLDEMLERLSPVVSPDKTQLYSDVGFMMLGLCLERHLRTDLATGFEGFCRRELAVTGRSLPLGYARSLPDLPARAVPTSFCLLRGHQLVGEVHDENTASLGGVAGHAGLFGSGPGIARFLHLLAKSETGRLVLAENARARATTDPGRDGLMGWRQGNGPNTAVFGGGQAIGHPGFTGTAFWIGPESRDYAIVLTNRVISGRTPGAGIAAFRREVLTHLAGH